MGNFISLLSEPTSLSEKLSTSSLLFEIKLNEG